MRPGFTLTLFHVTPDYNVPSIQERGIDPYFTTGKMDVCWFVSRYNIQWALLHVSFCKDVRPSGLVVMTVNQPSEKFKGFFKPGIYKCEHIIFPDDISESVNFIDLGESR